MPAPFFEFSRTQASNTPRTDDGWEDWVVEFSRIESAVVWSSNALGSTAQLQALLARIAQADQARKEWLNEGARNRQALADNDFWDHFFGEAKPSEKVAWSRRAREIHLEWRRLREHKAKRIRRSVFDSVARLRAQCGVVMRCIALAQAVRSTVAENHHACCLADYKASVHPAFAPPPAII